jgi:hypothetical protein
MVLKRAMVYIRKEEKARLQEVREAVSKVLEEYPNAVLVEANEKEIESLRVQKFRVDVQRGVRRIGLRVVQFDTSEEIPCPPERLGLNEYEPTVINADVEGVQNIPYKIEYVDDDLEAGTYYYRIVAVREGEIGEDTTQELSSPASKVVTARVYDTSPPMPPNWINLKWEDEGAYLEWAVTEPNVRCLLQRRVKDSEIWFTVSNWLEADSYDEENKLWLYKFFDETAIKENTYYYRLKLINKAGNILTEEEEHELESVEGD